MKTFRTIKTIYYFYKIGRLLNKHGIYMQLLFKLDKFYLINITDTFNAESFLIRKDMQKHYKNLLRLENLEIENIKKTLSVCV